MPDFFEENNKAAALQAIVDHSEALANGVSGDYEQLIQLWKNYGLPYGSALHRACNEARQHVMNGVNSPAAENAMYQMLRAKGHDRGQARRMVLAAQGLEPPMRPDSPIEPLPQTVFVRR